MSKLRKCSVISRGTDFEEVFCVTVERNSGFYHFELVKLRISLFYHLLSTSVFFVFFCVD